MQNACILRLQMSQRDSKIYIILVNFIISWFNFNFIHARNVDLPNAR